MNYKCTIVTLCIFVAASVSCSDGNSEKPRVAITTSAAVDVLGQRVVVIVNRLLADIPDQTEVTIDNDIASGADGGSVTMNGKADYSRSSSSTSTLVNYSLDVKMAFSAFKEEGLLLDGPLRYAEYYSYRYACSSSGCASSTHESQNYVSSFVDATGTTEQPIAVEFESEGVRYRDVVVIDIEDTGGSPMLIRLTTEAGEQFISYIRR